MALSNTKRSAAESKSRPKKRRAESRGTGPRADVIDSLAGIAANLRLVYSAGVTATLALRAQSGDRDAEIAGCLRIGVCEPVDVQIRQLRAIIRKVGGGVSESRS